MFAECPRYCRDEWHAEQYYVVLSNKLLIVVSNNNRYLRCVTFEDIRWVTKTIGRVAEEEGGEELAAMLEKDRYFVDFLR